MSNASTMRFGSSSRTVRSGLFDLYHTLFPLFRPLRKPLVVLRNPKHHLLGYLVFHVVSQGAYLLSTVAPVLRVIDEGIGHWAWRLERILPILRQNAVACR